MRAALILPLALGLAGCTVSTKIPADDGGVDVDVDAGPDSPDSAADLEAPQTEITDGPDEISRDTSPTFEFTATEVAAFWCSVDGEAPLPCDSPYTRSLGDGPHTFAVRAVDVDGNGDETPAERVWSIDTVAPETVLISAPPPSDNSVTVRFEFTSPERNVVFDCALDGGSYLPCLSNDRFGPFSDGAHSFAVRAHDRAGNVDSTPAIYAWSIDSSTPDSEIITGPSGSTSSTSASFTFVSPDAGGGAMYECALDGSGFSTCASPRNYTGLGEGEHAFSVRVRDAVGNYDPTPATRTWAVDQTAPDTTITMAPSGTVAVASASFSFVSDETGVSYACSADGAPYQPCTSPYVMSGLSQGEHSFAVRATDAAGHADPSPDRRTWTVDTIAPGTEIVSGPSGTVTTAESSFDFSATESGATFQCKVDDAEFVACTDPATITVDDGDHTLEVRAVDAAGNLDASPASREWTVDSTGPDLTITAGPAAGATVGPYVVFEFTSGEGTVTCSLDSGSFAACTSPVRYSLAAGAHSFAVRSTDGIGNATTRTRTFTVACAPPAVASGSRGLFHLDDGGGQTATNAVGTGTATLGDDATVETSDPAWIGAARFAGGLGFSAADSDHLTWAADLGNVADFTIELWARPAAAAGSQDLVVSGDGRIALRVLGSDTARFAFSVTASGGGAVYTATSAGVTQGAWHHVIASFDEPTLRLWVDGVRVDTAGVDVGGPPRVDSLAIGAATTAYGGDLDELHVSETAVTSDDQALPRYCPL